MSYLIAITFWIFVIWLIRKDSRRREGISAALWIPTIWAGILLSRPVTLWLNWGGGDDSLEGSPLDRLFYFGMIFAAIVVLSRRQIDWGLLFSENWPIFLFYAYMLVTVLWADSSVVSFKRWFKDFGNIFIALVILTEQDPRQAIRAVFVRCGYVLLPLSVIFVRNFPDLGRRYSRAGGLEVTGVTTQKNALGILVVVSGFVLLWDWLERTRADRSHLTKIERYLPFCFFLIGIYLLYLCDSATSILVLILGGLIILSSRVPFFLRNAKAVGFLTVFGIGGFFLLDWLFDIKATLVGGMGRDMTFTGRTNVWRELLKLKTDPVFGVGFCSFWSDKALLARLPGWVGVSAHNGYLETYIDGGYLAIFFLIVMLLAVGWRLSQGLGANGIYGFLRWATLLAIIIGDFSESHWARMGPLWFLFLVTSLELPWCKQDVPIVKDENADERAPAPVHGISPFVNAG